MRFLLIVFITLITASCTGLPEGVNPVKEFDTNRYLGKWYEIARLDHSFERGLSNVSAEYSLREDGGLRVLNRGFSPKDNEWNEAEGKAYFVGDSNEGHLKVSFFGPFYGSYVVFDLDRENYQYAFVAGYNKSYLWLLSRTPVISDDIIRRFVNKSAELGFDTDGLIYVDHKQPTP
jgi:apolipoprotein D and lipocalin family protein